MRRCGAGSGQHQPGAAVAEELHQLTGGGRGARALWQLQAHSDPQRRAGRQLPLAGPRHRRHGAQVGCVYRHTHSPCTGPEY
jgi:hypothetical protein